MKNISFQALPKHYKFMLDQIPAGIIHDLYTNFSFSYLLLKLNNHNISPFENDLIDYLKKFKLIIYKFDQINYHQENHLIKNASVKEDISSNKNVNVIICVESHCFIIESINYQIITNILKKTRSKIINTSEKISFLDFDQKQEYSSVMEEIENFKKNYNNIISDNKFIQYTFNPIFSYTVRRHFYPTYYFNDPSFFLFNHQNNNFLHKNYITQIFESLNIQTDKIEILKKLITQKNQDSQIFEFDNSDYIKIMSLFESECNIAISKMNEQLEKEPLIIQKQMNVELLKFIGFTTSSIISHLIRAYIYPKNYFNEPEFDKTELKNNEKDYNNDNFNEFKENDFITLRIIHTNEKSIFKLVIHIKTLYIFMMKQYFDRDEMLHEKYFCENCSHRCLAPFYGFLKEGSKTIGFIYEYMCNKSFDRFILSKNLQFDESYSIMSMIRIFEGIYYLHIHSIIHRDIKPNNILVNHNFIPYLSDFDNIHCHHFDKNQTNITANLGSILYTSPEQDQNRQISYLSDIYSFGLLIYFIFVKKNWCSFFNQFNNSYALINLGTLYYDGHFVGKNYFKAKEYYELAVHLNNSHAYYNLGLLYEKGLGVKQDYNEAKKYYELAAQQNNSKALCALGDLYRDGLGVKLDYSEAKKYYELAAQQNNSNAFCALGDLYRDGLGVKQDYDEAKKYYELAEQQENPNAFFDLGLLYMNGLGVELDYLKAIHYYTKSAQRNNAYALNNLGAIYLNGTGVRKDYLKAKKYFELSAQQNNSKGLSNLGMLYYDGLGVEQDYLNAQYFLELSAQQNNSQALFNLGKLYLEGIGIERNYLKAKYYFELLAQQNELLGYMSLALLYCHGLGVEKNGSKVKEYFQKAASIDKNQAYLYLGIIYSLDYSNSCDNLQAKYYFELAAKANDPNALEFLGRLYYHGYGVEKDYMKAKEYYELSAQQNNSTAFVKLGNLYFYGKGVEQNYMKSKELYEIAAQQNNSKAFLKLGNIYFYGNGIKQDYLYAKYYYELASQDNKIEAHYHLGELYSTGDFFEIDLKKSMHYFLRCIECKTKNNKKKYCYFSSNNLGLIYFIVFQNIEKAKEFIKEAAFAEFPFAQNNLGLLFQFYFNEIGNAEHMYQKSLEHKFSLASYNLGYLKEKENDINESIKFYKKASEYEEEELIFRDVHYNDKRLEISKKFISCYINLKLTEFYYQKSKIEKSKKYFIKSFSKLSLKDEKKKNHTISVFIFIIKIILVQIHFHI